MKQNQHSEQGACAHMLPSFEAKTSSPNSHASPPVSGSPGFRVPQRPNDISQRCGKAILVSDPYVAASHSKHVRQLRLVCLNVDGCGHYRMSPADPMEAFLTIILVQNPDILTLQEVT